MFKSVLVGAALLLTAAPAMAEFEPTQQDEQRWTQQCQQREAWGQLRLIGTVEDCVAGIRAEAEEGYKAAVKTLSCLRMEDCPRPRSIGTGTIYVRSHQRCGSYGCTTVRSHTRRRWSF